MCVCFLFCFRFGNLPSSAATYLPKNPDAPKHATLRPLSDPRPPCPTSVPRASVMVGEYLAGTPVLLLLLLDLVAAAIHRFRNAVLAVVMVHRVKIIL